MDENKDMDGDENENEGQDVKESDPEKELSFSIDSDEFGQEPDIKADTSYKMADKKSNAAHPCANYFISSLCTKVHH